jgi:MinD-like ATPase involved in chromosome partitioning or flagellar assembly
MAQKTTLNVLLLDMNIGRMDSRIVFGIDDPTAGDLGDLAASRGRPGLADLKKMVVNFKDSLNLIMPPLDTKKTLMLKDKKINYFIELLRDYFDLILIDIPGFLLGYIELEEIDIPDRFVFVSLPDIVSANNTHILLDHVKRYRTASDFYLVINKYNMKPAISPSGLANLLKYPVTSFIPYDRDIEDLVNSRGPGHIFRYRLRIVGNISGLASKIHEELGI